MELCRAHDSRYLLIDGPQAWKDSNNGLEHSRICERELNTPAKTGLPGQVKPRTYTSFVNFAIELFEELHRLGWHRFDSNVRESRTGIAMETFPTAAWRSLGIRPLPAKAKATPADILSRWEDLRREHGLLTSRRPDHDQLQAVVAGLAGLAVELGRNRGVRVVGWPPRQVDNVWREGYIILPLANVAAGDCAKHDVDNRHATSPTDQSVGHLRDYTR